MTGATERGPADTRPADGGPAGSRAWAGTLSGIAVWLGFELLLAPALGLNQARRIRLAERAVPAGDHLHYGLVPSETRRRPRG